MADTYSLTFDWPHTDAQSVIVTGTFDNWSSSVRLQKSATGFNGLVAVPWDSKILFKFIVDGNWVTHPSQPTETDASGFVNNVVHTPGKPVPAPSEPEPAVATSEETKKEASEEKPKPEEKTEVPGEVAPKVPVPIQPVLDGSTDTSPDVNPIAVKHEPSTHTPAPAEEIIPVPTASEKPAEQVPAPETTPASSTPPQKKSELPIQEAPFPVTPIKTNGTHGHGHARTSTGTSSSPPSSSAPSTPKTQRTFPTTEGDDAGSPSSKFGSLGRQKRQSFFGKLKDRFRGSPGKEKKNFLGSEQSRSPSPSPRK